MKRLFAIVAIAALFLSLGTASADSPRKVLIQHFTSASCPPCSSSAPTYYGYLKQNLNNVIPISFHGLLNKDVMEDHYSDAVRAYATKYSISTIPTVIVSGNKHKGNVLPTTDYASKVAQLAGENSPFTINIVREQVGITNNITVSLHSSRKYLNDLNLRVAVCEAYHYYENAGSTGEKDFYFINRDMLPDPNGMSFKVNANESKTFKYSFDLHPEWHSNMIYVVAWIQNDTDKEIYQAASTPIPDLTNIENKQYYGLNITIPQAAVKTPETSTVVKEITVSNPNAFEVKANFAVPARFSDAPDDWTVSIDKNEATIPAGGSTIVNMTINSGVENGLGTYTFIVFPNEVYDLPVATYKRAYVMSDSVKYVVFDASPFSINGPYVFKNVLNTTLYGEKTAVLPFNNELLTAFPMDDFDVAIFSTTTQSGSLSLLTPPHIDYIKAMLNKGKHVMVASDASGFAAKQTSIVPTAYINAINDFFTNVAKVKYENTYGLIQNNTLIPYSVSGANGDTITHFFASDFNKSASAYTPYVDYFSIPSGSPAIPICFYNSDYSKVAGVRVENENGSKLVFISFPLEHSPVPQMQQTFLKNTLRWFVGENITPKPEIITDYSELDFAQVEIGSYRDTIVEVYNIGKADLKISRLELANDPHGVFEIIDAEPRVIEPDSMTTYTIRFTPKDEKVYTFATMIIYNNDNTHKNLTIGLRGTGVLPQATGARVKLDVENITFDFVSIGEYSDKEVVVLNTGIEPLTLTELRIDGEGASAFEIISLPPGNIAPSATYTIRIRFRPTAEANYSAKVKFTSNEPDKPYFEIPMTGIGLKNIGVVENNNDLFQFNVGPNPFVSSTNVRLIVTGDMASDALIYLVDATGKKVAMLVNGAIAPGEHNFKFDGSYLPSGNYYMICTIGNKTASVPVAIVK